MSLKSVKALAAALAFSAVVSSPCLILAGEKADDRDAFSPSLKISVEERFRREVRSYPLFNEKAQGKKNFNLNKIRFKIEDRLSSEAKINFWLQDYRFFDRVPGGDATTALTDYGIYVANLELKNFMGNADLSATLGRQELPYGNRRLLAEKNWSAGLAWDGARFSYNSPIGRVDLFDVEQKRDECASPVQIAGAYFFIDRFKGLELYYIKKVDRNRVGGEIATTSLRNRDINTFGYNRTRTFGKRWTSNSEMAVQTGYWGPDRHRAYASHFEMKYDALTANKYNVALEYNEASGDKNPQNGAHGTFDNLFPNNHSKYGYMDYMSWQNMRELCLRNQFTAGNGIDVKLNFHKFELKTDTDSWYDCGMRVLRAPVAGAKDIGREVDLVFLKRLDKNVEVEFGVSKFYAGDYIRRSTPAGGVPTNPAWSYLQILKKW